MVYVEKTAVRKAALPLILLVYVVLGVAMSLILPLGEAPDEIDHFLYVRYLLEQRSFPVMSPVAADNETMEANQPPLFYLLNAAVTAPFPMMASANFPLNACFTFDPHDGGRAHFYLHEVAEQAPFSSDYLGFRVARLLSVLLGAIAVWLAYRLGRQMVPSDERVGLLAAAFLAFNPQFVFITASVNNDVLTAVLGAALVYGSVAAVNRRQIGLFVWLGVLMGLALLTKFALLALWPLLFLAAALVFWQGERKTAVWGGLAVAVLPVLTSSWWYVRAARLYGDPLAWDVHLQAKGSEVLRTAPLTLFDLREFVVIHFQSYWAWFGWLKIQAPGWVYGLLVVLVALAVVGLVLVVRDWRMKWVDRRFVAAQSMVSGTAVLFNFLAVAAIYASLLRYISTINWSGYQGRLAYAAAATVAALLGLGWWRMAQIGGGREHESSHPRQRLIRGIGVLPAVCLGLLSVGCLVFLIRPAFPRPMLFQPVAEVPRSCVRLAGLEVEALALADGRAGESLLVEPWLVGLETAVDQPVQIQVVGRDGQIVGQIEDVLSWQAGDVWQPSWVILLDEKAEAARGVVRFGLPGALVDVVSMVIRSERPFMPQPQQQLQADFGGQMRLVGYDWSEEGQITLYWQALTTMTVDYTTFVHVLDADGALLAQADSQPQSGAYPTSVWQVDEFVGDVKEIGWMEKRPLRVVVGVYDLESGSRLFLPDGTDAVTLFTLDETD